MGTNLIITDELLWGKLVKSWATGKNYVSPGRPAPPVPRTKDDLLAQAADIGLSITFPDGMVALEVILYSPQTAVIKLPPKSMVEDAERDLKAGRPYPMPRFYDDFYGVPMPPKTIYELLDLHAARIGDYSVRNCG
jgi:hypothetical protein